MIHNFDSIGQDIGRHLKIGEIIGQTKEIPKTNLFSFTEPDFQFINHHWLSEVIFFSIFSWTGFTGLILLKIIMVLVAFLILFFIIKGYATFWPIVISFILSIFIFISRTEVRPEIFSFFILTFYFFALFKAKYEQKYKYLYFLPIAQLFWVNLHIYFFIGPFLISAFLIDRIISKRFDLFKDSRSNLGIKRVIAVLILTFAATLVNPNGIQGALLPLNILNEYGYRIVENQTLFFLADFFKFNLPIFIFKLSAVILISSLILTTKKSCHRIFEIIISTFFIYAGFRMLRNLPLYALVSFPIMALILTDIQNYLLRFNLNRAQVFWRLSNVFKILVSTFLVFMIFFVVSGDYYKKAGLFKVFGFSVPNGLERAVGFVKQNKVEGPMFNNFDIGGYLIWQLYPQEKVFVDNRPEAYSVKFFNELYKPMQENKEKWLEFSEKYGINFIFFGHTDATPWGDSFIRNIVKNPDWKIVYINEDAIIFVKNNKKNAEIISKFSITSKNAVGKISDDIKNSNKNKTDLNLALSRTLFNINLLEPAVYFADEVIKVDSKNSYAYLYKGIVHIYYPDKQNQKLAAENIKKAIDLGLKESRNYTILGMAYINLGQLEKARASFKEAVRLDKNSLQAKEFLHKYFND